MLFDLAFQMNARALIFKLAFFIRSFYQYQDIYHLDHLWNCHYFFLLSSNTMQTKNSVLSLSTYCQLCNIRFCDCKSLQYKGSAIDILYHSLGICTCSHIYDQNIRICNHLKNNETYFFNILTAYINNVFELKKIRYKHTHE